MIIGDKKMNQIKKYTLHKINIVLTLLIPAVFFCACSGEITDPVGTLEYHSILRSCIKDPLQVLDLCILGPFRHFQDQVNHLMALMVEPPDLIHLGLWQVFKEVMKK